MAKPEWGIKRICPECSTRYYDFKKATPACPKCKTKFDPEALLRSRRGRSSPAEDIRRSAAEESLEDIENLPDVEAEESEDEALIEDASELGSEENVEEVVEREEDEER